MLNLSSFAFNVQKFCRSSNFKIKHTHILEILAAFFGYKTYASYCALPPTELEDAEYIILQSKLAEYRALELRLEENLISKLIDKIICLMQEEKRQLDGSKIYASTDDFLGNYLQEWMNDSMLDSDEVSCAMSETNAYLSNSYIYKISAEQDILNDLENSWIVTGDGVVNMKHDQNKFFYGDKINVRVQMVFTKVCRVGLIFAESDIAAGVDEAWREADREAEYEFLQQQSNL